MRSLGSYLAPGGPRLSIILALTFACQATIAIGVTTPAVAAGLARCRDSQLAVSAAELPGRPCQVGRWSAIATSAGTPARSRVTPSLLGS